MANETIKRMTRMHEGVQIARFLSLNYRPMLVEIGRKCALVAIAEVAAVDGRVALDARQHLDDRDYLYDAQPESFTPDTSKLLPAGIYMAAWYECGTNVYILIDKAHRCIAQAPITKEGGWCPGAIRDLQLMAELNHASECASAQASESVTEPDDDDDDYEAGEEWKRAG